LGHALAVAALAEIGAILLPKDLFAKACKRSAKINRLEAQCLYEGHPDIVPMCGFAEDLAQGLAKKNEKQIMIFR